MTDGKPAGVKCIHLLVDYRCAIYNDRSKPKVCMEFKAEPEFCGRDREEAMKILSSLVERPEDAKLTAGSYLPELYTISPPVIV